MRKALCLIVVLLAVTGAVGVAQQPDRAQVVPGRYIVVFKDAVADVPGLLTDWRRPTAARRASSTSMRSRGLQPNCPSKPSRR